MHPFIKKREKTRLEIEQEMIYGHLPEGWEIINYKSEKTGDVRPLFVNHSDKTTTWIDPRKKKNLNL
jgi:hypothetical protein